MLDLSSYKTFPVAMNGAVLAIGNFDGVHLGHKAVLNFALDIAAKRNAAAGVMFFSPHPRQYFSPDTPLFMLTNPRQKRAEFENIGLDFALELPFDAELAQKSAKEFVTQVLVEGVKVSHVVVGYDFFFGRGRGGNPQILRELGEDLGFGVTIVDAEGLLPSDDDKEPNSEITGSGQLIYSSSLVRDALEEGQVKRAASILGRNWQVEGVVTSGAGRGEGLGFPTANISLSKGCHLHHGIYAAFVHHKENVYEGAAYFGKRPSFDNSEPVLEVFLFDYDDNLYGEDIAIEFVDFVREDMKFSDMDALKAQMDADCKVIEQVLSER
ncbi:bifunctional riboflavin kinase/FAD synthetase [Hyphomicrobiales bacterium 4NK60-0047b]|jgi:riboflavin kinase/FMN adenylyltransferase